MKNINHLSPPGRLIAMAGRFAAVVSIGTALLLLAGIHSSQAAEIKIVSPSAYEHIEGNGGGPGGTSPFRFQQVFPAADFAALGNKPHWLVGYSFRPDETLTNSRTVRFPDNEIRLSTTQSGPGELSSPFDDNFGPDVMQFYRGLVILATEIDGTSPVPREFYNAEFPAGVTPYLYDPSQGNLLFDVIGWQGISPSTFNDRVPGVQTTLYSSNPSATDGEWIPAVMFQFTFVPVQSTNAQLIINGSFETPDTTSYTLIYPGENTIAHWMVGLHSVDVGDAALNGFITGPAFEGEQMLDLNGLQRGRLTQGFATTPGSLYTVTFAYANNYYNSSSPASATVRLFDGLGDRLNQTITHTGSVAGDLNWTVFTAQFTALQNATSLEFTSLTDTDGYSGGIMLDAVQVFEGASLKILSITGVGNGSVMLNARGVPKGVHRIQASVDLTAGSFTEIGTVTADAAGLFQFTDQNVASFTRRYYRASNRSASLDWRAAERIDPAGLNNINTSAMEGCPIESPDGRSLFFASNRAGGQGGIDIWIARRDGTNDLWRDPVNLPVNSAFDDFCPTPLPNGDLFFVSRRPNGCSENSADMFFYPNQGGLGPVILNCEVNSAGDEFSPSYVSAGGGTLFFSSNRDGTHKIYASAGQQRGGFFNDPVEVTKLNAPGFNTFRPNVSEDGLEIVFDSDRPGGLGGPDVWSATRASASDPWSAPVNLGPNVNSDSAETRPSLSGDGKRLTFGSTRPGGQGSGDIYVSSR